MCVAQTEHSWICDEQHSAVTSMRTYMFTVLWRQCTRTCSQCCDVCTCKYQIHVYCTQCCDIHVHVHSALAYTQRNQTQVCVCTLVHVQNILNLSTIIFIESWNVNQMYMCVIVIFETQHNICHYVTTTMHCTLAQWQQIHQQFCTCWRCCCFIIFSLLS